MVAVWLPEVAAELQRGFCGSAIGRHLPLRYHDAIGKTVKIVRPTVHNAEGRVGIGNAVDAGVTKHVGDLECYRASGSDACHVNVAVLPGA